MLIKTSNHLAYFCFLLFAFTILALSACSKTEQAQHAKGSKIFGASASETLVKDSLASLSEDEAYAFSASDLSLLKSQGLISPEEEAKIQVLVQ